MWTIWLADTKSGRVLASLRSLKGGSAKQGPLNGGNESARVQVDYATVAALPPGSDEPWVGTLLFDWDGELLAAAVLDGDPSQDQSFGDVEYSGASVLDILAKRILTGTDFGPGREADLAATPVGLTGSYGDMIWSLLTKAQQRPNGELPITRALMVETASYVKNYKGWNVANNDIEKLVKAITELQYGPDYRLDPEWVDDSRRSFHWVYRHSTDRSPGLGASGVVVDLTAPRAEILRVATQTERDQYSRLYGVGAGTDEGTLITIEDHPDPPAVWLESVYSESDTENPELLRERTRARLLAGAGRIVQVAVTTSLADARYHPQLWKLGQSVALRWPEGWRKIPAGQHTGVVLKRSFELTQASMTTDLQFIVGL